MVKHAFWSDGVRLEIDVTPEEDKRLRHIDENPHLYGQHHVDYSCCEDDYEQQEEPEFDDLEDERLSGICCEVDHFWESGYLSGDVDQRRNLEDELNLLHSSRFPDCSGPLSFVTNSEMKGE